MDSAAPLSASPPVRVARMESETEALQWDAYVLPRTASVTDLFAWRRVVEETYRHRAHYLAAFDGDRMVGTLGLFEIKHPIFGHYITTAVYTNDGGFHFDHDAARDALIRAAQRITEDSNGAYLAIRTRAAPVAGFEDDTQYLTARIDLGGGADAVWNRLPSKTRNQVRRGQKEGFTVSSGQGQIGAFFDVFHQHMRVLGSPAHGRAYYQAIQRHCGEFAEFVVVRDGAALVGGALMLHINGTATNYHAVSLREFNRRCPNYLLYWRLIETSCARGCTQFDMGRSRTDSSNIRFKENWNPDVVQLHYNYWLCRARKAPNLNPGNPAFRLQIAIWQRMPLFVTKIVGPRIIAGIA